MFESTHASNPEINILSPESPGKPRKAPESSPKAPPKLPRKAPPESSSKLLPGKLPESYAPLPTAPRHAMRTEHEYARQGAWAYLAAWDVRRAKIYDRCEGTTGIAPFERLMAEVMTQEPYRSARRVFWTMDNGSSHRGQACVDRIHKQWPSVVPVHTPVHASWLNQVEIYFSILQRKALTPNDFPSLEALEERLHGFARYYEAIAKPFQWKFTRADLDSLLDRIGRARTKDKTRLVKAA